MIARLLFLMLMTVTSLNAQDQISPFVNFDYDSGNTAVIMTIESPAGKSTVDIGEFTETWRNTLRTAMGVVTQSILVSDDQDDYGVPLWYTYVVGYNNHWTYETHFYGMITYCGHSLHDIQAFPRPKEIEDLTSWCRF